MNINRNHHARQSTWVWQKLAGGICFALFLIAGSAQATTLLYDAYVTNALPQNIPSSPWTQLSFGGSATISGPVLTLTDPSSSGYGPYWAHGLVAADFASGNWEIRSRLRILSYSDNGSIQGEFQATVEDSVRYTGFGLLFTNGQTEVFHQVHIGTPVVVTGSPFLNIVYSKVGPNETLTVYDDANVLIGSDTRPYNSVGGGDSVYNVYWGETASVPTGVIELTGISFGFGEAAPNLIPEPSVVALGMLGALAVWHRRCRR